MTERHRTLSQLTSGGESEREQKAMIVLSVCDYEVE